MDAELRTEAAELRLGIALRTGPADGIAGMIEFEKEERQARSTGARQSYQPAGGLFERNIEARAQDLDIIARSEEHTSELQSLMRISYAVFCLKKKKKTQ